jgi:hypothetical protein
MLVATTGVDSRERREKGDLKSVMVGSQRRCASEAGGLGRERFEVWWRQVLCILEIAP